MLFDDGNDESINIKSSRSKKTDEESNLNLNQDHV